MGFEPLITNIEPISTDLTDWTEEDDVVDMTNDEQTELEAIFELCEEKSTELNSWEHDFVNDNQERYKADAGGQNGYFVSVKMWKIFRKIRSKLQGSDDDER